MGGFYIGYMHIWTGALSEKSATLLRVYKDSFKIVFSPNGLLILLRFEAFFFRYEYQKVSNVA